MPLTLYLVRHGRTRHNEAGLLQGWCDSPLTDDGVAGVAATGRHLRAVPFTAAYASPSPRAVTTAARLLEHHPLIELATNPGLREFSFGDFEARPEIELYAAVDPLEMFRDVFRGTFAGLPGGEPGGVYLDRVSSAFAAIEAAHAGGGPVLVVSHGVTLLAYLATIGVPTVRPLANASVTTVDIHPGGRRIVTSLGVAPAAPVATPG
ncbi:histidine phosphatase family protein [Pengzhenrongella sicca]|uniref:Histidine phosphatase family protein n=1 Tax=Pengzhenrongella sicca TaxID=2819238 RepID=A0A8A4ZEH7_9MICO|nr:histidine phosphatase family protein [Pengzhenrongella sicca]QTE30382.1 histidine phosphatase family protein [Pengzhenrongella sicca]